MHLVQGSRGRAATIVGPGPACHTSRARVLAVCRHRLAELLALVALLLLAGLALVDAPRTMAP